MMNPMAMVALGATASIPIAGEGTQRSSDLMKCDVLCSLFTVFQTRRAKQAQSYVNMIYGSLTILLLVSMYLLYHLRFARLPEASLEHFLSK